MPPKLTEEQRIQSAIKRAEYQIQWKENNKEKFDEYMRNYYITNKKELNSKRIVYAKRLRNKKKTLPTPEVNNNA